MSNQTVQHASWFSERSMKFTIPEQWIPLL